MRRRPLLLGLGTAASGLLAGCASGSDAPSTASASTTPVASAEAGSSSKNPFRFEASVVHARPTADRPPVVEISVTNAGDASHVLTIPNETFPFAPTRGEDGDGALVLAADVPSTREGDCWTGRVRVRPRISGREFAPGESASHEYAVVNAADADACWPAGAFRFGETYYLDPDGPDATTGGTTFEWSFTLAVGGDRTLSMRE